MLLLTGTSDLVQIVTTAAVATHIQASWIDNNAGTITPGRTNTIVSTAATTTVVGSPAAATSRNVKFISVRAVGGLQGVTLKHTDGTNAVEIQNLSLQPGELLVFTDTAGWQVFTSLGYLKTNNSAAGAFTILNVKDYGAKGDGSTDDKAAIQAAINAAGAAGVSGRGVDLYFPAGIYALSGVLTCNFNNVMLRGSGWQSTVLYCTITTGDVLQFGDGSTALAGCGLMNMSVWKSAAGTTGSNININKMNDVLIQNFVVNNGFIGISLQGASIKTWIDQGEINNTGVTTGHGIQVTNGVAGDTYIRCIIMSNNPANKPASGINIISSGHIELLNCNVTSAVKGLLVNPGTGQDVSYLFVEHCLFDSCGSHGAHFTPSGSATGRVRSVVAVDSWFSGTTAAGSGIEFTVASSAIADGFDFIGCRILNNFNAGITINAGPQNISFTDCTIAGNGAQTINTFNAVEIAANVNSLLFQGNKIGQAGTAGNQQKFAINIAAGTSSNIVIVDNDCQPNGTLANQGYIQVAAITGGGNAIHNNNPATPIYMGTALQAATAAFTTAETIVTNQTAQKNRFSVNAVQAGTSFRFHIWGTCTVTTAASTWQVRVRSGVNNTTADGILLDSGTFTSGGVGTSNWSMVVVITSRVPGASGTFHGTLFAVNSSATLGLLPLSATTIVPTFTAVATTNANYINLTMVGSANVSLTVQGCTMEVVIP